MTDLLNGVQLEPQILSPLLCYSAYQNEASVSAGILLLLILQFP